MCRALARAARGCGVQWIRYPSARRLGGRCAAALTPECLSLPEPARLETWLCKVTAAQASMLRDEDRLAVALAGRGRPAADESKLLQMPRRGAMHTGQTDGLIERGQATAAMHSEREQVQIGDLVVNLHAGEIDSLVVTQ